MFANYIMEKGDKPKKTDKPKTKAKKTKKPTKPKKVVKKPKVVKPKAIAKAIPLKETSTRGTTAVEYLGEEKKINQVITKPSQRIQPTFPYQKQSSYIPITSETEISEIIIPRPKQPPPQPPLLSEAQAPTSLDTELTAVSELVFPKARTPAFQEVQEPVPKRATKAKVKKSFSEGIGDFIKKNLLEQPPDLHTQEPSNAMEEPRPPLSIIPEEPPVKPKPKRKQAKGKTDVPIEIFVKPKKEAPPVKQLGMEEINVAPTITVKPKEQVVEAPKEATQEESIEQLIKRQRESEFIIPEKIDPRVEAAQRRSREAAAEVVKPKEETLAERIKRLIEETPLTEEELKKREASIAAVKEYRQKQREQMEEEERQKQIEQIEDVNISQGVESLQDPELERDPELEAAILNLQEEVIPRRIVADTIEDIISTIETPVFSENPDFRTISQNVELESPESDQLDYGELGESTLGEEGFIPVGKVADLVEAIEKRGRGRPSLGRTEELARDILKQQKKQSYEKLKAEKILSEKFGNLTRKLIAKSKLDKEYEEFLGSDFVSLQQATEAVRGLTEGRKKQVAEEGEMEQQSIMKGIPQIYLAQPIEADDIFTALDINKKAYDGDFQSKDFNQQFGDLTATNNFAKVIPMVGDVDQGYSDENPKVTTALFSDDPEDSNLPFIGAEGFEFLG